MAGLPHITTPMAATEVPRPFHHPGWVYEEKVDGWRVFAYKNATGVRLISRNGRDLTRRFPDCLDARGKDLRKRPLRVRRNVLEELVDGHQLVLPARRLADDGLEAWAQVLARGYEGLVGKDEASAYVEGRTLPDSR
jgi:bifunctional non-homologous end joining protein LigD